MTYEEFMNKYCALCGTQRCTGIYDKFFREGCSHYKKEFLKEKEEQIKFVTCEACSGSGVGLSNKQCQNCYGFGTVIIYEENENDRC